MPTTSFLYFSFVAGLVAFFAPCSFVILPGYISYYISKYLKNDRIKSLPKNALQGFVFGIIASAGFFTVFGAAGFGVIAIGQFVKHFIPLVAIITGIILIIIGILMLFNKNILFFQAPKINFIKQNEKLGIYLFGIVYAVGSLGCVFPIFLSIVLQGIAYKSFLDGVYTILAYILGMSIIMTVLTTLTFTTKYAVFKKLEKILPYIKRISTILLIIAGIYMIYYQFLLLK